jgi:hypothetical protein
MLARLGPGYKGNYVQLQTEEEQRAWRQSRSWAIKELTKENARLREQNERALAQSAGNAAAQACFMPWPLSRPGRARAPPSRRAARGPRPPAAPRPLLHAARTPHPGAGARTEGAAAGAADA